MFSWESTENHYGVKLIQDLMWEDLCLLFAVLISFHKQLWMYDACFVETIVFQHFVILKPYTYTTSCQHFNSFHSLQSSTIMSIYSLATSISFSNCVQNATLENNKK